MATLLALAHLELTKVPRYVYFYGACVVLFAYGSVGFLGQNIHKGNLHIEINGLYYKHIMIINDDSRVISK